MRIGFFGGSFNPPTNAHISLAKTALEKCKLDKIIFIPMGDFYGKQGLAKAKYRYEMLEIVCKAEESFEVSDIEIKVNKKLDTIDAFRNTNIEVIENKDYKEKSATEFRNLWRKEKANQDIIPKEVIEFIEANNIY